MKNRMKSKKSVTVAVKVHETWRRYESWGTDNRVLVSERTCEYSAALRRKTLEKRGFKTALSEWKHFNGKGL